MANTEVSQNWRELRGVLEQLCWGEGLTRQEMIDQEPGLRKTPIRLLPRDYCFRDPGSVMSYLEHLAEEGIEEMEDVPPPVGYGDRSTTGMTVPGHENPPSVGSGYGSGPTGSSAQTGVGRWGISEREPKT
jgi:hypothetical protein